MFFKSWDLDRKLKSKMQVGWLGSSNLLRWWCCTLATYPNPDLFAMTSQKDCNAFNLLSFCFSPRQAWFALKPGEFHWMQTTLGFSLSWAVALDRVILVSNRKWWFGEFYFAVCSCFLGFLEEKGQMQPGDDWAQLEGWHTVLLGKERAMGITSGAPIALTCCLPRSDDSVFISLTLLPSNGSFPDAKIRCLNAWTSKRSFFSVWVSGVFTDRSNPGCFTAIQCGGGGGEQRKGKNSVWLLTSGFMCSGSCAKGEGFIDHMT